MIPGRRGIPGWMERIAIANVALEVADRGGCRLAEGREEDLQERGQWIQGRHKCCLFDRDHFRPVLPARRNLVAWQPQPQNITSTGRWPSIGEEGKGDA